MFDDNSPQDLNAFNLEKLYHNPVDDTITIAFVGDSQRFYDEVDDFVEKVNSISSVDFILLAGDITDFGLLQEFEWINRSFSRLHHPYFTIIGNHDVIANGEQVFERMFGPLNDSFVYDSVKFILHNTNGREYRTRAVPDIQWLKEEIEKEETTPIKNIVAVSHVPPTDGDFSANLVDPYTELFASASGFLISLHGHVHHHTDSYPFNDGTRYITSYDFSKRSFILLKIVNGKVVKQLIDY